MPALRLLRDHGRRPLVGHRARFVDEPLAADIDEDPVLRGVLGDRVQRSGAGRPAGPASCGRRRSTCRARPGTDRPCRGPSPVLRGFARRTSVRYRPRCRAEQLRVALEAARREHDGVGFDGSPRPSTGAHEHRRDRAPRAQLHDLSADTAISPPPASIRDASRSVSARDSTSTPAWPIAGDRFREAVDPERAGLSRPGSHPSANRRCRTRSPPGTHAPMTSMSARSRPCHPTSASTRRAPGPSPERGFGAPAWMAGDRRTQPGHPRRRR